MNIAITASGQTFALGPGDTLDMGSAGKVYYMTADDRQRYEEFLQTLEFIPDLADTPIVIHRSNPD